MRDLGQEHHEAEADGDRDPDRLAFVELRETVFDPDDCREEEVDRGDQEDYGADRDRDALRILEELRLLVGVVLGVTAERLFA